MFLEINFNNSTNNYIQGYLYEPNPNTINTFIYYFHGYGGYFRQIERIGILNSYIDQGYSLCGIDMIGHGLSGGKRGQISDFDSMINDNVEFIKIIKKKRNSSTKFILLGHSLGGACALALGTRFNLNISGVVSLAPLLDIAGLKNSLIYKAFKPVKMLNGICPKLVIKPLRIKFPNLAQKFPEFKDIIINDELVFRGSMTLNTFVQVDDLRLLCAKSSVNIKIPVLIIHGKKDDITCYKASKKLFQKMNNTNKTFVGIEDSAHYLILDSKKQIITKIIMKWIQKLKV